MLPFIIVGLLAWCESARAEGISSTAHMGIAVEQRSSTGFHNAAGSVMMFDVARRIGPQVAVGLRTNGQGGGNDFNFYRMSAGPLVTCEIGAGWLVHAHLGAFRESATEDGARLYRSSGMAAQLGWERRVAFAGGAEFLYGGYWGTHSGAIHYQSTEPTTARLARPARINDGLSKGLEVGLRIPL